MDLGIAGKTAGTSAQSRQHHLAILLLLLVPGKEGGDVLLELPQITHRTIYKAIHGIIYKAIHETIYKAIHKIILPTLRSWRTLDDSR